MIPLSDMETLRYAQQILLPHVLEQGQIKLKMAKVAIVGLGGLGTVASQYLARAGVGHLLLIDHDKVSLSNLHRQVLYHNQDLNKLKANAAKAELERVSDSQISVLDCQLRQDNMHELKGCDLVLDCTDNFASRYQINTWCKHSQTPLISAAASGLQGQLLSLSMQANSPCYQCVFPDNRKEQKSCLAEGVLGPVVGIMGNLQALQAIKLLTGQNDWQPSMLHCFNGDTLNWQSLTVKPDPDCPVCQADIENNKPEVIEHEVRY